VSAGEKNTASADSHHFEFWLTSHCPDAPAFRGGPLLAVEFTAHVNWVLPEKPE
jgi:hypothetical protein